MSTKYLFSINKGRFDYEVVSCDLGQAILVRDLTDPNAETVGFVIPRAWGESKIGNFIDAAEGFLSAWRQ